MDRIRKTHEKLYKEKLNGLTEQYALDNKQHAEAEDQKKYLLSILEVNSKSEVPAKPSAEVKFLLQNPFEGRFREVKKQSYTIKLSEAEQRE